MNMNMNNQQILKKIILVKKIKLINKILNLLDIQKLDYKMNKK